MTFKIRNRIRWALALFGCVGSVLLCHRLEDTILITHLFAAMWCPVHRPWRALWRHWAKRFGGIGAFHRSATSP